MHHAIALLSELSQNHLDWIFDNGVQQQVDTHDVVILEGSHPDAIYFVLKGVVGIYSKSAADRQIAVLGPGEIIGEMSFLMDCRATASVVALETVLLLAGRSWLKAVFIAVCIWPLKWRYMRSHPVPGYLSALNPHI